MGWITASPPRSEEAQGPRGCARCEDQLGVVGFHPGLGVLSVIGALLSLGTAIYLTNSTDSGQSSWYFLLAAVLALFAVRDLGSSRTTPRRGDHDDPDEVGERAPFPRATIPSPYRWDGCSWWSSSSCS